MAPEEAIMEVATPENDEICGSSCARPAVGTVMVSTEAREEDLEDFDSPRIVCLGLNTEANVLTPIPGLSTLIIHVLLRVDTAMPIPVFHNFVRFVFVLQ